MISDGTPLPSSERFPVEVRPTPTRAQLRSADLRSYGVRYLVAIAGVAVLWDLLNEVALTRALLVLACLFGAYVILFARPHDRAAAIRTERLHVLVGPASVTTTASDLSVTFRWSRVSRVDVTRSVIRLRLRGAGVLVLPLDDVATGGLDEIVGYARGADVPIRWRSRRPSPT